MAASELTGKDLWLSFNGTVLSVDFRNFEESQEVDLVDVSAASDDDRTYAVTINDGSFDYTGLCLSGGSGTVIWDALAPGTEGTLIWASEGSVAGKPKWSCNAIAKTRSRSFPYDGVMEISANVQKSGAITSGTI